MKMLAKGLSGLATGVTLSLAVVNAPATAATFTGTFQVDVTPTVGTPLASRSYFGTYSFEDAGLSGIDIKSPVSGGLKLTFDFVNLFDSSIPQTYTEADDISNADPNLPKDYPQLSLTSGTITGLNYFVATSAGSFSVDGSTFSYIANNSASTGEGTVKFSVPKSATVSVPESSPVLGLGMLGLLGTIALYSKSKKQQTIYSAQS